MFSLPCKPRALPMTNFVPSMLRKLRVMVLLLGIGEYFSLNSTGHAQVVLIPTNALWRYFDSGVDMGFTLWRSVNFMEDFRWKSGPAELGYGSTSDGRPLATTVSYGADPTNKFITTYFRH